MFEIMKDLTILLVLPELSFYTFAFVDFGNHEKLFPSNRGGLYFPFPLILQLAHHDSQLSTRPPSFYSTLSLLFSSTPFSRHP